MVSRLERDRDSLLQVQAHLDGYLQRDVRKHSLPAE